jgi:hypothetical protein
MRAELIGVLKKLTRDQQYDIATHLANNIGYKLVQHKLDPSERLQLLYDIKDKEGFISFLKANQT